MGKMLAIPQPAAVLISVWFRRKSADLETVNIAAPFGAGTYLVAHGGSTETVNAAVGARPTPAR
jgi:hypothetical protein